MTGGLQNDLPFIMSQPGKIAATAIVVLAIGTIAFVIEILRLRMNGWLAMMVVSIIVLVMALLIHQARAQHPPEHQSLHEKFYSTWMRPDNRSISCCHNEDCAPAQSRRGKDGWQARHADSEPWIDVPPTQVERERDSPDGRSHLCKSNRPGNVFVHCFLPASGS